MMLVIRRRTKESFQVGEAVVTVERIGTKVVTLSVEAPQHVKVQRLDKELKKNSESSSP